MQLGIRAHDLGPDSPQALAHRAAERGLQLVQLAPGKALVPPLRPGQFDPVAIREIARAFAQCGVEIAVLGCYINPIHPDPDIRRAELTRFKETLRHAAEFGCALVATETGSRHADCSFHPDNHSAAAFGELLDVLGMLGEEARAQGVSIGIEAAAEHVIHDVGSLHRAITALDAKAIKLVFDPVNIMGAPELLNQGGFLDSALPSLGPRIAALHVKDVVLENGRLRRVPPGQGLLDYSGLLTRMRQLKEDMPVIMEETDQPAERDAALRYLRDQIHRYDQALQH